MGKEQGKNGNREMRKWEGRRNEKRREYRRNEL